MLGGKMKATSLAELSSGDLYDGGRYHSFAKILAVSGKFDRCRRWSCGRRDSPWKGLRWKCGWFRVCVSRMFLTSCSSILARVGGSSDAVTSPTFLDTFLVDTFLVAFEVWYDSTRHSL